MEVNDDFNKILAEAIAKEWRKKLKPCPFCGDDEAIIMEHTFYELKPTYGVYCNNCGVKTKQFYKTAEDAAEAWNRRVSDEHRNGKSDF